MSSTTGQSGSFTCQACGQNFNSQQELQNHNQQMHGGNKPK
ncbi:MAG: hypothetical protein ACYC7D_03530 [Nitrososphaerales archaeon]